MCISEQHRDIRNTHTSWMEDISIAFNTFKAKGVARKAKKYIFNCNVIAVIE
jgi:hypothetical protein